MKSMRRGQDGALLRSQPSSTGVEKPSWQRSTKRKFQHSPFEPLLPPSSTASSRVSERGVRSLKPVNPQRMVKSLSAPLKVYSDSDQRTTPGSISGGLLSDKSEDMASNEYRRNPGNVSRERKIYYKQGLKDNTNIEPVNALKQGRSRNNCYNVANVLALKEALQIERESIRLLQEELDEERNAAASAADEAMAMIARLQEEKAAVLMEARQFKRMADERERHNQEAISVLKEMVSNKEEEISALEHELETCRHMFFAIEGGRRTAEDSDYPRYIRLEANSEGYDTCASRFNNGFSRLLPSEDNTNSRYTWRSSKKNFTGLISDDIRSNLASCFNMTDELEKGDTIKQLTTEKGIEMVSGRNTDNSTMYTALNLNTSMVSSAHQEDKSVPTTMICDDDLHINLSLNGLRNEALSESCREDQHRPVWSRIMRLEHRLETFGTDRQHIQTDPEASKTFHMQEAGNPATEEAPQDSTFEKNVARKHFGSEYENDETKRPSKLQCREGCLGYTVLRTPSESISESRPMEENLGSNCVKAFTTPENPSTQDGDDMAEWVYDVYEIGHESSQGSQEHCYGNNNNKKFQSNSSGNRDLAPELTAPDLELMDVQSFGSHFTPETFKAATNNVGGSLSRVEIQQLTLRLHALETERQSMNQAISTLRKENEELKVLQNIAQELHQLRRTMNSCGKETESDQSVYSLFKGFLSYLRCGTNSEERNLPLPSQNSGVEPVHPKRAGLSYLLEKSPHLKTGTMMVRGMKARVPHI